MDADVSSAGEYASEAAYVAYKSMGAASVAEYDEVCVSSV